MGSCLSLSNRDSSDNLPTAKVISLNGNLSQYSSPIKVSQVLEMEPTNSCFLCNSDQLFFDDYVREMDSNEELQVGQIYFILPNNRLKYRLSASDMAALAVKASSAFMKNTKKTRGGRKKLRISPVLEMNYDHEYNQGSIMENWVDPNLKRFQSKPTVVEMKKSGSVRKLQKNASRRAKFAIRSFRMRLNTIYEGSIFD